MTALPLADFTDAQSLALARMEAEPEAPESLRERATDAMHAAVCDCGDSEHGIYFWAADMAKAADAAIDVLRGPSTCTTCGEAEAAVEERDRLRAVVQLTAVWVESLATLAGGGRSAVEREIVKQASALRAALAGEQ